MNRQVGFLTVSDVDIGKSKEEWVFDELTSQGIHMEMLDEKMICIGIRNPGGGGRDVSVVISSNGKLRVKVEAD